MRRSFISFYWEGFCLYVVEGLRIKILGWKISLQRKRLNRAKAKDFYRSNKEALDKERSE